MADYDPQLCEDYVNRALELGCETFVRLWLHAAGLVPVPYGVMTSKPRLDSMVVEWENLSPWDKQGVLFLMVRYLEDIARQKAMEASHRARVQDPI